jgi:hypothetical protein
MRREAFCIEREKSDGQRDREAPYAAGEMRMALPRPRPDAIWYVVCWRGRVWDQTALHDRPVPPALRGPRPGRRAGQAACLAGVVIGAVIGVLIGVLAGREQRPSPARTSASARGIEW